MTLNGETNLYRWFGGLASKEDSLTLQSPGKLERALCLPYGDGDDRPEGFTVLPSGELLVVYDQPAERGSPVITGCSRIYSRSSQPRAEKAPPARARLAVEDEKTPGRTRSTT